MTPDALNGLLSPKQVLSIVDAQARVNLWHGAIRSGKTIASLLAWLIYVAQAPPGELVVIAKTSITAARNVFGPLQDPALFGKLAAQTSYTPGAPFATILGRRVSVIGANDARSESRLRGLTCAGAYVDEASLVPRDFWVQLLGRMSVPGAKLFGTTNPDNPQHWLRKDFILRAGQLNLRHWHFKLADNPSLTREYVDAISAEFTGLFYRRFIQGEWVQAEGAVYDTWDPDIHVVDEIPPIQQWLGIGVDYGTKAPFAALLLGLAGHGGGEDGKKPCLYLVDEWRWDSSLTHRQLTDVEYSKRLRDWIKTVRIPGTALQGPPTGYLIVDPSALSFKVQATQDKWTVADADNTVLDGIRVVSSLIGRQQLKVARSCTGWGAEIGGYSWDEEAAKAGEDKIIKADDHSLDAGRYAVKTTQALWNYRIGLAA